MDMLLIYIITDKIVGLTMYIPNFTLDRNLYIYSSVIQNCLFYIIYTYIINGQGPYKSGSLIWTYIIGFYVFLIYQCAWRYKRVGAKAG